MSKATSKPKSRKGLWIGLGIVLLIVIVGFAVDSARRKRNALEIAYREVQAARGNLKVTILATGTVEPQNRLEIKPPVSGRVEEVLVKEGQNVTKGQVLAWMSSTERAALLDAARAQGPAAVKNWEQNYRPTPILAPIAGTIISRNVESGQTFNNTDSVLVMSDRLTIKTQVDETDIAEIKLQQTAQLQLDAYPKDVISAKVDQIAYDAKTVNNVTTYIVDVLPEATPEFMRSGMTANVTFLVAAKDNAILVPNEALHVQGDKYSVLVRGPGKTNEEKPVQVGLTDGKQTEIVKGLFEGETMLVAEIKSFKEPASRGGFQPFGSKRGK